MESNILALRKFISVGILVLGKLFLIWTNWITSLLSEKLSFSAFGRLNDILDLGELTLDLRKFFCVGYIG